MPFSTIDPQKFSLDTVKSMQAAFDKACAQLNLSESDPRRSTLATAIIKLAAEGKTENLSERAVETVI